MFNIGDRIVYPNQGVGVIDLIEEIEFNGEMQNYYKVHLFNTSMKLSIPFSRIEPSNIRLISDCETIDKNLKNIDRFITIIKDVKKSDFKERMNINSEKIKNGTLIDYLEVICNLTQIKTLNHLNTNEQKMLDTTKKFLIEEIRQAKNLSHDDATALLESSVKSGFLS